jgi:DNA-binding transcriptional MocR family regulator
VIVTSGAQQAIELVIRLLVSELYYCAVRRGIAFVAGEGFYAFNVNPRTLRVSFGFVRDDVFEEGVARLCSVAKDLMPPRSAPSPIFTWSACFRSGPIRPETP